MAPVSLFNFGPFVNIQNPNNTSGGAIATAILSGGVITGVAVTNGGSGYTVAPTISFGGDDGSGATATATIAGGAVTSITVTNGGSGYTEGITDAIDGIVWLADVAAVDHITRVSFVTNSGSTQRAFIALDPSYIVGGGRAYCPDCGLFKSTFHLAAFRNRLVFQLSTSNDSSAASDSPGPELTDDAESNLAIAIQYGTEVVKWLTADLVLDDPDEPYRWLHGLSDDVIQAIADVGAVKIVLFDTSIDGYDYDALTYEAPVTNTAPTVTFTAPHQPRRRQRHPDAHRHVQRRPRKRHRHNHHCRQSGHAGRCHEGRCGGHVGSRVHRTGQHHRRTDRHCNRHGYRRWQPDRYGKP